MLLSINFVIVYIYRRTKNKVAGFILIIFGAFDLFLSYKFLASGFEGFDLFGFPFLAVGIYSVVLPLKSSTAEEESDSNTETDK